MTILSRGQRYDFKLVSARQIGVRLDEVLGNEKISAEWRMFTVAEFLDRSVGTRLMKDPASVKGLAQLIGNYIRSTPQWASAEMIDALLAYDRRSVLRGRDWIERNLTTEQVVLILQRIQAAHA